MDGSIFFLFLALALLLFLLFRRFKKASQHKTNRLWSPSYPKLPSGRTEAPDDTILSDRTVSGNSGHEEKAKQKSDQIDKVRRGSPDYILKSRIQFHNEYKSSMGDEFFGQERSPLACFGYRVGKTNGRKISERHKILEYTLHAEIPDFFPEYYRREWGDPLSFIRFNRILSHLNSMADLRAGRKNFDIAVSDWRRDATWFKNVYKPNVASFLY